MKSIFLSAARLLALCALTSLPVLAQPSSGGPTPGATAPTETPLDGGASLLLAGGVTYAIQHLRKRRNKA